MYTFPEIHLWCDTCRPLGSQHGNQAILFHIPATCIGEARMEDLSHHRLSYAGSDPRGSTFPFACILIQMNPKAGAVRWYFKHWIALSMTFYLHFQHPIVLPSILYWHLEQQLLQDWFYNPVNFTHISQSNFCNLGYFTDIYAQKQRYSQSQDMFCPRLEFYSETDQAAGSHSWLLHW